MPLKLFIELLSNIGVVQVITNGEIISLTNSDRFKNDIGNEIAIQYEKDLRVFQLPFEVILNDQVCESLKSSKKSIRCKYIINRMSKPLIDDLISKRNPQSKTKISKALKDSTRGFLSVDCTQCSEEIFRIDQNFPKLLELPDENWKEMMDLWHCHKPDITTSNTIALDNIFTNKLVPKYNNLLVGDFYYLLNTNILTAPLNMANTKVQCRRCRHLLGSLYNETTSLTSYKIFKEKVAVSNGDGSDLKYEICDHLSMTILVNIKSYGSRFFTVKSQNAVNSSSLILIWCLDYGVSIGINNTVLDNRLKIMYQMIVEKSAEKTHFLENLKQSHNIESILLEDEDYEKKDFEELTDQLHHIHKCVTFEESAQLSNDWKLSYL